MKDQNSVKNKNDIIYTIDQLNTIDAIALYNQGKKSIQFLTDHSIGCIYF